MRRRVLLAVLSLGAVVLITVLLRAAGVFNHTTIALSYLLLVLCIAAAGDLPVAAGASVLSATCLNFFFIPPVGTLTIAEPENWLALFAFLVVSIVASQLSASVRARAEHALDAALLRQRAELASALLASLSHDLRTPLTAIRTAVSNLDSPGLAADQRRDQARVAAGQIDRLTRLFDSILDMARIDSGTVTPERSWTTPAEIVDAALSRAAGSLAGHDVHVDATDEFAIEIDPRLASSALAHLLENAARYAPDGAIAVRSWTDEEGVRIEVRDSGPGLQAAELEHLFKPFFRGQVFRQRTTGTGMGLAITRGLVAADGGRVWAENLKPAGACFSISIPAPVRPVAAVE